MPVRPDSRPMVEDSHASRAGPRGYRGPHRGWRLSKPGPAPRWAMVKARPAFCSTSATPEVTSRAPSRRRSFRSRSWAPVCRSPTPADGRPLRRTGRVGTPVVLASAVGPSTSSRAMAPAKGASWAGTARGGSLRRSRPVRARSPFPATTAPWPTCSTPPAGRCALWTGVWGPPCSASPMTPKAGCHRSPGHSTALPSTSACGGGPTAGNWPWSAPTGGAPRSPSTAVVTWWRCGARRAGRPSSPGNPAGRSPPRPTPAVPSPASATAPTGCSYPRPTLTE